MYLIGNYKFKLNNMKYSVRRFSTYITGESIQSEETTVNGDTLGSIKISRGEKRTGHKPTGKTIKIKYHA